jgi:hypothetical protein
VTICIRKRRYETEERALEALANIAELPRTDRIPTRAYACPVCSGWHVTSQSSAAHSHAKRTRGRANRAGGRR